MHIQKDDEQTLIRTEQERKQNRSTRPRKKKYIVHDIRLADLKRSYEEKLIDIKFYQKKIRTISYTYIDVLDKVNDNSDSE
jgi:hypothetical protein